MSHFSPYAANRKKKKKANPSNPYQCIERGMTAIRTEINKSRKYKKSTKLKDQQWETSLLDSWGKSILRNLGSTKMKGFKLLKTKGKKMDLHIYSQLIFENCMWQLKGNKNRLFLYHVAKAAYPHVQIVRSLFCGRLSPPEYFTTYSKRLCGYE